MPSTVVQEEPPNAAQVAATEDFQGLLDQDNAGGDQLIDTKAANKQDQQPQGGPAAVAVAAECDYEEGDQDDEENGEEEEDDYKEGDFPSSQQMEQAEQADKVESVDPNLPTQSNNNQGKDL